MLESLTFFMLDLGDLELIVIANMKVVQLFCSSSS